MQDQNRRRLPLGVVAGLSALILATGSATAWWSWSTISRESTSTGVQKTERPPDSQPETVPPVAQAPAQTQSSGNPSTSVGTEKTLQVYWLRDAGTKLELVPAPVVLSSNSPTALLSDTLKQLMAGPDKADVSTTIPSQTKLLAVSIQSDGIHVNLSKEFTQGGGTTSMTGRVAQVLYTATSLDPKANVWLSVDGQPLTVLGGEGLELQQPMTRQTFERDFDL